MKYFYSSKTQELIHLEFLRKLKKQGQVDPIEELNHKINILNNKKSEYEILNAYPRSVQNKYISIVEKFVKMLFKKLVHWYYTPRIELLKDMLDSIIASLTILRTSTEDIMQKQQHYVSEINNQKIQLEELKNEISRLAQIVEKQNTIDKEA